MFHTSIRLNQLAMNKADSGCRKALKAIADKVVSCGNQNHLIWAYELADNNGYFRSDLTLTVVFINQAALFFHKAPDEVLSLIEGLQPEKKAKVPSRTLVKMIASRIQKVHDTVRHENKHNWDSYRWQMQSYNNNLAANGPGARAPVPPVDKECPEFRTVQSIRDFFANNTTSYFGSWEFKKLKKKFENEVFVKPELTDDDISSAMDLVAIGQVVEE